MIAVFAFSDKIKKELQELLEDEAIRDYRDDINRQNIIDWFQETVSVHYTFTPYLITNYTLHHIGG